MAANSYYDYWYDSYDNDYDTGMTIAIVGVGLAVFGELWSMIDAPVSAARINPVSYTHLRAHET